MFLDGLTCGMHCRVLLGALALVRVLAGFPIADPLGDAIGAWPAVLPGAALVGALAWRTAAAPYRAAAAPYRAALRQREPSRARISWRLSPPESRGHVLSPHAAPVGAGTRIRYMGNKRALAVEVAAACGSLPPAKPLIDLFGGMCNVAGAIAPSGRTVHVNDIQAYATLAATCLIASRERPRGPAEFGAVLRPAFLTNRRGLRRRYGEPLAREAQALRDGRQPHVASLDEQWAHAANDREVAREVAALRVRPERPYRLCTLTFAFGYFSLTQSIDLDSLRYAIDASRADGALSPSQARWARLAMLQTASRIAATSGHFAQYLRPRSSVATARIVAARRRDVWTTFLKDLHLLRPYGAPGWRASNTVSQREAVSFVEGSGPSLNGAIFYADPPYSKEHYSRFYHVLETLERYDYPEAEGVGRVRPDRFRTDFAVRSRVRAAMTRLLEAVAAREGTLLLSYPSSGLLTRGLGVDLGCLLSERFCEVRLVSRQRATHSTLGARHGASRQAVDEELWLAR